MLELFGHQDDADATDQDDGQPPGTEEPTLLHRWARVLLVIGLAMMLVSGLVLIGSKLLVDRYIGNVQQESLLGGAAVAPAPAVDGKAQGTARIDGPLNILLAGIDERAGNPSAGARADTIIILHIPAAHDRAYLVSVPRDSRVDIPAFPKTGYAGGADKVNAAFAFGSYQSGGRQGGFELLALTIKQLTGLSFNAGAILDFEGLQAVVDSVGGVDMCVDEETPVAGGGRVYHLGCQHFSGTQALEYVRQRQGIPDGDYGRQRHQQQLLTALAKKIAESDLFTNPLKTDRILRSLGDAVTFDGNGASLQDWALQLKGIDPNSIRMIKTNGGRYTTQVINGLDFEILTDTSRQLFAAIHDDTLDAFVASHPDWVNAPTSM